MEEIEIAKSILDGNTYDVTTFSKDLLVGIANYLCINLSSKIDELLPLSSYTNDLGFIYLQKLSKMKKPVIQETLRDQITRTVNFLQKCDLELALFSVRENIGITRIVLSSLDEHEGFEKLFKSVYKASKGK
jgi:hypothetical protein